MKVVRKSKFLQDFRCGRGREWPRAWESMIKATKKNERDFLLGWLWHVKATVTQSGVLQALQLTGSVCVRGPTDKCNGLHRNSKSGVRVTGSHDLSPGSTFSNAKIALIFLWGDFWSRTKLNWQRSAEWQIRRVRTRRGEKKNDENLVVSLARL